MSRFLPAFVCTLSIFASVAGASAQTVYETVAITEFMNTPIGEPESRSWIELYNFGKEPVDLNKFTITDGKNDIVELPAHTIKPGDYAIVVVGHHGSRFADERKKIFELEWLGGKADPRVIGTDTRLHMDGVDGLKLINRKKIPIWLLGWSSDAPGGYSTYLLPNTTWAMRSHGTVDRPGIIRKIDPNSTIKSAYRGQQAEKEDVAYTSDVSKLEAEFGIIYQTSEDPRRNKPSIGSPLKGNYKPMQ